MILVAITEVDLFQENLDSSLPYPFTIKVYPFSLCSLYSSNPEMDCAFVGRRVNEESEHLQHAQYRNRGNKLYFRHQMDLLFILTY